LYLVIVFLQDAVISKEAVDWMEQRLPQCTLSVIEGGTHGLLWRADVVSQIFKGIASSWKLAEFERALTQRWSIKQLGLNKHQSYRSSTCSTGLQQAIQTSNIYDTQQTLYQSPKLYDDPERF
jgi:hypothetical protein